MHSRGDDALSAVSLGAAAFGSPATVTLIPSTLKGHHDILRVCSSVSEPPATFESRQSAQARRALGVIMVDYTSEDWVPHEGFETITQSEDLRVSRIALLRGSNLEGAEALARQLESCDGETLCRLGACPACMRDFRLQWVREAMEVLDSCLTIYRVSAIPDGAACPTGQLPSFDLTTFIATRRKALQRKLRDHPGLIVLGGVDVSLNTFNNKNPLWVPHLYLLVGVISRPYSEDEIRQVMAEALNCGVNSEDFRFMSVGPDDLPETLTYAVKPEFYWRSGYEYLRRKTGNLNRNTRYLPLPVKRQREALLFLGKHSPRRRLLLVGVKSYGNYETSGRLTLKLVKPPCR